MHILFENKFGKIDLCGKIWRITDIEGLGLAEKTVSVIRYPALDGQEIESVVTYSRDITLSGDILRKDAIEKELSRAIRILNHPGVLKIHIGTKKRKIKCRCTVFSANAKDRNALYQSFVMQLVCDNPYFEDFESNRLSLFVREDLIKDSFTLPCKFSRRISRVKLVNSGDAPCRPCIFLVCNKAGNETGATIEIINHTTGQRFCLEYQMHENEEITVDFDARRVETNLKTDEAENVNLISYMSDDTYLSDFHLDTGVNDVECIVSDVSSDIQAICQFSAKYVEAVI